MAFKPKDAIDAARDIVANAVEKVVGHRRGRGPHSQR